MIDFVNHLSDPRWRWQEHEASNVRPPVRPAKLLKCYTRTVEPSLFDACRGSEFVGASVVWSKAGGSIAFQAATGPGWPGFGVWSQGYAKRQLKNKRTWSQKAGHAICSDRTLTMLASIVAVVRFKSRVLGQVVPADCFALGHVIAKVLLVNPHVVTFRAARVKSFAKPIARGSWHASPAVATDMLAVLTEPRRVSYLFSVLSGCIEGYGVWGFRARLNLRL